MFFDSAEEISKVDRQLVNYIEANYKPVIFVVNKWDLVAEKIMTEQWAEYLQHQFSTMWYTPIAFITAKEGRNVRKLLNTAQMLYKQAHWRVSTGTLNRLVRQAMLLHPPPVDGSRRPKIFFGTQVGTAPPTIVLKCSDPDAFPKTYRRYLLGVLRDQLKFGEIPIRMFLEKRDSHSTPRPGRDGEPVDVNTSLMDNDLLDVESTDLETWVQEQSAANKLKTKDKPGQGKPVAPKAVPSKLAVHPDDYDFDDLWEDEDEGDVVEAEEYSFDGDDQPTDDFDPEDFDNDAIEDIYNEAMDEDDESECRFVVVSLIGKMMPLERLAEQVSE